MIAVPRIVGATAAEAWTQARRSGLAELELLVLAPATVRDRDRELDRLDDAEAEAAGARAAAERWFPVDAWFEGGVDGVWAWGDGQPESALWGGGRRSAVGRALTRLQSDQSWTEVALPPAGLDGLRGLALRIGPGGHVELRALWCGDDATEARAVLLGLGRLVRFAAEALERPAGPLTLSVRGGR